MAYAQVLTDEQGESVTAFLRAAVAYYAALGVRIREVLTDNGGGYRSDLFAVDTHLNPCSPWLCRQLLIVESVM